MPVPSPRQALVVGSVVGGIALGASGDYGSSSTANTLIVPADEFFGVWGPIYAGALAYAAHQARPSKRDDEALTSVALPAATAYLASGLWVHTLEQAPTPVGLGLITGTAAAAIRAASKATRAGTQPWWATRGPLGLFAGWLSLASVVAGAELLAERGLPALATETGGIALSVAATAGGIAVTASTDLDVTYPAAIAYGLVGIAVANARTNPTLAVVATACAALTAAHAWYRRRRRPKGSAPADNPVMTAGRD